MSQIKEAVKARFVYEMMLYAQDKFPNYFLNCTFDDSKKEIERLVKQAEHYSLNVQHYTKQFIAFSCHYNWSKGSIDREIHSIFMNRNFSAKEKFTEVRRFLQAQKMY